MELKPNIFLILSVVLGGIFPLSQGKDIKIFVVPPYPDPPSCPCPNESTPCDTLNYYNNHRELFENNDSVNVIMLCGLHTNTDPLKTEVSLCNLYSLTVKPQHNHSVTVSNFNLRVENVNYLYLENLKISNVDLQVYPTKASFSTVHMQNCLFTYLPNNLFVSVNLTIKDSLFKDCSSSAINLFQSHVYFEGEVSFINNTGVNGGALAMLSSHMVINSGARIAFVDNSATGTGGAIFIDNSALVYEAYKKYDCFYTLVDYDARADYYIIFTSNKAQLGGDHIYGASMQSHCSGVLAETGRISSFQLLSRNIFEFNDPSLSDVKSLSPVSGHPMRVCLCDENNRPQCVDTSKIVVTTDSEYFPGERIHFKVSLVGGDFGTTTGTVYISSPDLDPDYSNVITDNLCTVVNYTIFQHSQNDSGLLCLSAALTATKFCRDGILEDYKRYMQQLVDEYHNTSAIDPFLLDTPVLINVTFIKCPPGFYLQGTPQHCDCHGVFKENTSYSNCFLRDGTGLVRHSTMWVNATYDKLMTSKGCPLDYCSRTNDLIDLQNNPDVQCAFNHSGVLCGGCIANNSLAIGSSNCVYCTDNINLALLIFFAAAGLLLVLVISTLNLTITQGMVNGLIFYANIVWAYRSVFFPSETGRTLVFFKVFIAWLNLDFGIEVCFFRDMDAFIKTWLQFVFPLYILIIVGLMIAGARLSKRLTKLLGNRAVPILDTLFLLSYSKLLRTTVEALSFTELTTYYDSSSLSHKSWVWVLDGELDYVHSRHGWLLFVAVIVLFFLWVPYTFLLLLVQVLRRFSGYKPFRWVSRLYPIYDTHLAPLKPKHQYWFGILLVTRGMVHLTSLIPFHNVALFLMSIIITLLFTYMVLVHPYKMKTVFLLQSLFFLNLILLMNVILFVGAGTKTKKVEIAVAISCAIAFLQFGIIITMSVLNLCDCSFKDILKNREKDVDQCTPTDMMLRKSGFTYRDSILNETLLN